MYLLPIHSFVFRDALVKPDPASCLPISCWMMQRNNTLKDIDSHKGKMLKIEVSDHVLGNFLWNILDFYIIVNTNRVYHLSMISYLGKISV